MRQVIYVRQSRWERFLFKEVNYLVTTEPDVGYGWANVFTQEGIVGKVLITYIEEMESGEQVLTIGDVQTWQ